MQSMIVAESDSAELAVIALNHTASAEWLNNYVLEKHLTFPMIPHAESIHANYQIGFSQYGNFLPSYFIINPDGIITTRIDGSLGIMPDIKTEIQRLINLYFP